MPLPAGFRLGSYDILAPLGAGGMGEVYRARDTKLERQVAVKILPADTADSPLSRARFEREARAVAALSHPNILAIHDYGSVDGVTYASWSSCTERRSARDSTADRSRRGAPPRSRGRSRSVSRPLTRRASSIAI